LMIDYRRRIEKYTVRKIVAEALADTATFKFQPQTVPAEARERLYLNNSPVETTTRLRNYRFSRYLRLYRERRCSYFYYLAKRQFY
jgi:hypothetical protein